MALTESGGRDWPARLAAPAAYLHTFSFCPPIKRYQREPPLYLERIRSPAGKAIGAERQAGVASNIGAACVFPRHSLPPVLSANMGGYLPWHPWPCQWGIGSS